MPSTRRCERRGQHDGQRGQGLVEFALVAPLLIALAFGIFDFGRGMSANVTVTNSAREGARALATTASGSVTTGGARTSFLTQVVGCPSGLTAPPASSAEGKAWRQMQAAGLDLTQVTMKVYFYKGSPANDPSNDNAAHSNADDTITCSSGTPSETSSSYTPATGDWVQFEVAYHYTPLTPMIGALISTVQMDQVTTMVLE